MGNGRFAHNKRSLHSRGVLLPEDKGLSETDVARIKAYFMADKPTESQESLLALLEPQLFRDDCCRRSNIYLNKYSEYQSGYKLFQDHDEDFQRFTLIAFCYVSCHCLYVHKPIAYGNLSLPLPLFVPHGISCAPTQMIRGI
ncbi:hypothetical protein [Photobacterium sanguinicancri]|uniref:hypothetical protein n=1 Tax=Photobacterium sanguinicancri TaxID=875932 RepID=UPI001F1509F1|nr:hypothetical protein [Photobacterium sanguinicancri]